MGKSGNWGLIGILGLVMIAFTMAVGGCGVEGGAAPSDQVVRSTPVRTVATATPAPPQVLHVSTADAKALLDFEDKISPTKRPAGQLKGTILNDMGEPCWFKQGATPSEDETYFLEGIRGSDTLLLFDDLDCMTTTLGNLGMGIMQRLINDRIVRFYYNEDVKFTTRPAELYPTIAGKPLRGWCIQSTTHPLAGVVVEYFTDGDSIVAVLHGIGITCGAD